MLESLSSEELQFIKAIEKYKNQNGKLFLSWSEVLKILKGLGYRKIACKPKEKRPAEAPSSATVSTASSPASGPSAD